MPFTFVRIDFSDDSVCNFCPIPLTSGKVRILKNEHGREVQAGPTCTLKHSVNGRDRVPDLTRAALEPEVLAPAPGEAADGGARQGRQRALNEEQAEQQRRDRAESYVVIRAEKLSDLSGMCFGRLQEAHQHYAAGGLTPDDYRYIGNLMAKVERERPEYSLKNLQAVYAARYWARHLLKLNPTEARRNFLESIIAQVGDGLQLSERQVERLNDCLRESEGRVLIAPDAFVRD